MKKIIVTAVVSLLSGIIAGLWLSQTETFSKTKYEKQTPVAGTVIHPAPVKEVTPKNPNLPTRADTVYGDKIMYVERKVDTAAIIEDYIKKRSYEIVAFDDEKIGRLELKTDVQYNKLDFTDYTFTPVRQINTVEKKRVWTPFLSASYSTLHVAGVGAGVFYHDVGVEYMYQFSLTDAKEGHCVGVKYRF